MKFLISYRMNLILEQFYFLKIYYIKKNLAAEGIEVLRN